MKCPCCGEQINLYSEVKQLLNEMGINKQNLQEQITQVINSSVNNAMKENLDKKIEKAIERVISEDRYVVRDSITNATSKFLAQKLKVSLKEE